MADDAAEETTPEPAETPEPTSAPESPEPAERVEWVAENGYLVRVVIAPDGSRQVIRDK